MAATVTIAAAALGGALAGCSATGSMEMAGADREDCPGQTICPLTGELVCIDRCPLNKGGGVGKSDGGLAVAQPAPCCAGKR
jgi:hypothetical protein